MDDTKRLRYLNVEVLFQIEKIHILMKYEEKEITQRLQRVKIGINFY